MNWDAADQYLENILKRPGMYGALSIVTLQTLLLNLLILQCKILDVKDYNPRKTLFRVYEDLFGESAGACGPSDPLSKKFSVLSDHPEILNFYRAFVRSVISDLRPYREQLKKRSAVQDAHASCEPSTLTQNYVPWLNMWKDY